MKEVTILIYSYFFLLKLLKNKLTVNPKNRNKILVIEKLLGNKIKVEPIVNPIIEYIV